MEKELNYCCIGKENHIRLIFKSLLLRYKTGIMEHVGHYYTVYFTSLAVGFNEKTAFRQAVYAQMPDQVDRLDAVTIQEDVCFSGKIPAAGGYTSEQWRPLSGLVLHAFPYASSMDKTSKTQQDVTKKLLQNESPDSLAFGFLLHRLGDAYSHVNKDNPTNMYPIAAKSSIMECVKVFNWGHFKDGHDSDYIFVRPLIFYNYLEALYEVLLTKATATENSLFRRDYKPMAYNTLKAIFKNILESPRMLGYQVLNIAFPLRALKRKYDPRGDPIASEVWETYYMIRRIRQECELRFGIKMNEKYEPEKIAPLPFEDYKKDAALKGLFGENSTVDTLSQTLEKLDKKIPESFSQIPPDYADIPKPPFDTNKDINSIFQSWPR